jgi:hypothetical protein
LLLLLPLAAKVAATPFPAVGIGCYLLLVGGGFARVARRLGCNLLRNIVLDYFLVALWLRFVIFS